MKITASNITEFNQIDEILQKITDKEFVKSLDYVEILSGTSILRASKKIYVDKIVLPKNVSIQEVIFSSQSHYNKEANSQEIKETVTYSTEVTVGILNSTGHSEATMIITFHGFSKPQLKLAYY